MKSSFTTFFVVLLASLVWGQNQGQPSFTTEQLVLPVYTVNITPASQANTALVGNPGPQTVYYWMVSNFSLGASSPIGPFVVDNVPNTLSGSNYVTFAPVYPAGVVSIDLLKTSSPSPPTGACNCAVATGVTSGAIHDQSNSTSGYTVAPINVANYTQTLTNEVQGAGSTHLILRQNGVFVADLSTAATGGLPVGCSSGQTTTFNGTTWICSSAGTGTVTGSGTLNTIPIWTSASALGNSPLSYDGTTFLTSTAALSITSPPNNVALADFNGTFTGSSCTGSGSIFNGNFSVCSSGVVVSTWPVAAAGQIAAFSVEMAPTTGGSVTGTPAIAAVAGLNVAGFGGGTVPWLVGTLGYSELSGTGTVSNFGGAFGKADLATGSFSQTATIAFGVGGQIASGNTTTQPFGAALIAYSPILTGVVSQVGGLYVQDQTVGGSTNNPSPFAIITAGTAPSTFGGALTVSGNLTTNMTGGPFCVHETSGVLSATAADCGSGGSSTFAGLNTTGANGINTNANTIKISPSAALGGSSPDFSVVGYSGETSTGNVVNFDSAVGSTQSTLRIAHATLNDAYLGCYSSAGGINLLGAAVNCSTVGSSPYARNVFSDSGAATIIGRVWASNASYTGDMFQFNTASSGTGFNILSGYTGVTSTDSTNGGGTQKFYLRGDGQALFANITTGSATSTFGGAVTVSGNLTTNMTGGPFCVHETSGVISATAADCGSGGGSGLSGMTALGFPIAATATTITSSTTAGTNQGTYLPVRLNTVQGTAVSPTEQQVGIGGRAITGATSTDPTAYSDVNQVIDHDQAGSAAVTETIPTPATLNNTSFGFLYWNQSAQTDILKATTPDTIQSGSAAAVAGPTGITLAPGQVAAIKQDPNLSTQWLVHVTDQAGYINGGAVPASAALLSSNSSKQIVAAAASTAPIAVGATGAISCATCVTSAAALTNNAVVIGGGLQASSTISADTTTTHALFATAGAPAFRAIAAGDLPTTLTSGTAITNAALTTPTLGTPASGTLTNTTGYLENNLTGASAAGAITEGAATASVTRAGIATANLTAPWVFQNTNSANNNTSITLGITAPGTSTGQTVLNVNGAATGGDLADFGTGGTWTAGVLSGQTIVASVLPGGAFQAKGTTAGFWAVTQGSTSSGVAPCNAANTHCMQAPTALTAGVETDALALAQGVPLRAGTASAITDSYSGDAAHAVSATAQTASIATATVCAATAGTACGQAGQYRVSFDIWGSGTACSSVTAGKVVFTLTWTDAGGTAHTAVPWPLYDYKSALQNTTGTFNFNTALGTEGANGSMIVSTNGTVIQYASTYTACTTGTGTYNVHITTEQLQ